jgi:hypothetical protein
MNTRTRYSPRKEAGWALKNSGPSQKVLALVLGQSEAWVSRQCTGHESAAVARFYEYVKLLTVSGKTEAGPLIAGSLAVANGAAEGLEVDELLARLSFAHDRETIAQHAEDIAQHRVMRAVARCTTRKDAQGREIEPTPEDLEELADAITIHDEAILAETGWHCTMQYYARGYLLSVRRVPMEDVR